MSGLDQIMSLIKNKQGLTPVSGPSGFQTSPTPTPTPDYNQRVTQRFVDTLGSANPARNNPQQYFPILGQMGTLRNLEKQYQRPGLADFMALQSLYESTGGRHANTFGVLPPGGKQFGNINEAIKYQVGPHVLGGGAGNSLNILNRKGPITPQEITKVYQSYNPNSPYIKYLISDYKKIRGI